MSSNKKAEYVIFDVDGLLINSEHIYTTVIADILAKYGKAFTWEMKARIMGRPAREAAAILLSTYPDTPLSVDSFLTQYDSNLARLWQTVKPLPGAQKLVRHLHANGVPMALATGSRRKNHLLKTKHLQDIFGCFGNRVVCGDDLFDGMKGKPEPDLFLLAARAKLGLDVGTAQQACTDAQKRTRQKVLVLEDGVSGLQAAKRAGMSVIWVPDAHIFSVGYSGVEQPDLIIKSLEDFAPEDWGFPSYDEAISGSANGSGY